MVDWGGLENRCGLAVTGGSNPPLSAIWRLERMTESFSQVAREFFSKPTRTLRKTPGSKGKRQSLQYGVGAAFVGQVFVWGSSSVGRAPGSQSGGRGFDPHLLHHPISCKVVLDGEIAVPCTRNPL